MCWPFCGPVSVVDMRNCSRGRLPDSARWRLDPLRGCSVTVVWSGLTKRWRVTLNDCNVVSIRNLFCLMQLQCCSGVWMWCVHKGRVPTFPHQNVAKKRFFYCGLVKLGAEKQSPTAVQGCRSILNIEVCTLESPV